MSEHLTISTSGGAFERIKRVDEDRNEFWSARDLARILEYADFRNFLVAVEKAKEACAASGHAVKDHFVGFTEMVGIGSGARRPLEDWKLSRYACYSSRMSAFVAPAGFNHVAKRSHS